MENDDASLVVMPTASGKSHVIAETAHFSTHTLILQPSRELLAQNMAKLDRIERGNIGIYSASFNEKNIRQFTFATIQSVYKKPELFAHFDLIIIDECHMLAPRSFDGMFMSFIKGINIIRSHARKSAVKIIGFTATAYRLENGYQWAKGSDGKNQLFSVTTIKLLNRMRHKKATSNFWKRILYSVSHRELLAQGFLSPIEYIDKPLLPYAEIPVNKSHSDYDLDLYAQAVVGREANILRTISEAQKRYKSILVFCSTTLQAMTLQKTIKRSEIVLGETDKVARKEIVEEFKAGTIQTIFNVGTLTTGFDYPSLDCIILLRPTRSLVLYNQILGRLTRLAEGKAKGTVIDLTGTCKALGRIETFELYQDGGLWDLRTEKRPKWHNRVIFSRNLYENKK